MRCLKVCGSDDRMDCAVMFYDPINTLPKMCPTCGFPDLDHIPQPYFLVKSRTMSPNEMAMAENGHFFVRDRVRRVLELFAPGECEFHQTCFRGTAQQTPWMLAVPKNQVATAKVDPAIRRCKTCGEPSSAHPGSQFMECLFAREAEHHVLKSATWGSCVNGWGQWISRDLFLSVRLFHLLKKLRVKGFDEATCGTRTKPNKDETVWVAECLRVLESQGIPLHPAGTMSDEDGKWFREFLNGHSRDLPDKLDIKLIEKRLRFKLPKAYVEFIEKVGPLSFENVDDEEGFAVEILSPEDLDTGGYRAGALEADDDETNAVDGVMFATTGHGDCFCFDVQKGKKEYAIYLYKHELNCFEPYAENFAACIRRFTAVASSRL